MLAIANCQAELKDTKAARKTIEELVKAYPKSEAAQAGRERLVSMRVARSRPRGDRQGCTGPAPKMR